MISEPRLESTLRRVVTLLVNGDYEELEQLSGGDRLSAAELEEAVTSWGRTLVEPPNGRIEGADVVAVENSDPHRWSVWLRLWTAEEGRSDLTLEVTLIETGEAEYAVEIDNLEVA